MILHCLTELAWVVLVSLQPNKGTVHSSVDLEEERGYIKRVLI